MAASIELQPIVRGESPRLEVVLRRVKLPRRQGEEAQPLDLTDEGGVGGVAEVVLEFRTSPGAESIAMTFTFTVDAQPESGKATCQPAGTVTDVDPGLYYGKMWARYSGDINVFCGSYRQEVQAA